MNKTFEEFYQVFKDSEEIPTSKRQMLERCHVFFLAGIDNEKNRIEKKILELIK